MPPIRMTREERASLGRLVESSLELHEIPKNHIEKFINHGLAVRQALLFKVTTKGQLEFLRQRFRNLPARHMATPPQRDLSPRAEPRPGNGASAEHHAVNGNGAVHRLHGAGAANGNGPARDYRVVNGNGAVRRQG